MLIVSIALEAAVAILAVLAARRGKPYIYGLAFTFGAYVLYDLAQLLHWNVQAGDSFMVVSTGDDQRPDLGLGVVPEMVREQPAGSSVAIAGMRAFLSGAPAPDTVLLQ